MKDFEFFEHTADAKFKAYGKTLEEAFSNAARAMYTIITDISKVKPKKSYLVEVSAKKKESLLFDFISKLVYLTDTEGFLLSDVQTLKIIPMDSSYSLNAVLLGDVAGLHELSTQVKAPTYSDMFIKEEKGLVTLQMVLDI
ncbi:MAG: archease [Nanoarchaeota archaeon]|nr:archease [Nanoarchaeota archaeon]